MQRPDSSLPKAFYDRPLLTEKELAEKKRTWKWRTLTDREMRWGASEGRKMFEYHQRHGTAKDRHEPISRDEQLATRIAGMQSEIAHRRIHGIPMPATLLGTFATADAEFFSVKASRNLALWHHGAIHNDRDPKMENVTHVALIWAGDAPRFAEVGVVDLATVEFCKIWAHWLPTPNWVVPWVVFQPWPRPPAFTAADHDELSRSLGKG